MMENREVTKKVNQAFSHIVPDVRDAVLSDCEQQKGRVLVMTQEKQKHIGLKKIIGIAAAFMIVLAGIAGFSVYNTNYAVASTVSLDVNPSIEIKVNRKERVLEVNARNEDAQKVIGDMVFTGNDLDVTVNALIGSMLRQGYLSDIANSILVSVDNTDTEKGAALQKKLADEINSLLQTDAFIGAVLSQTVSADAELQKLADTYGITLGKAQLIQEIAAQSDLYTFEDLVRLSINELNLLRESGQIELNHIESVGAASDKAYIGEAKAKEKALAYAGVTASSISSYEIELDYENGVMVYEIEFKAGGYEYSVDINATTGEVVKSEKEKDDDAAQPKTTKTNASSAKTTTSADRATVASGAYIGEAKAKEIVLAHAGVTAENVYQYSVELDTKKTQPVYEIEFKAGAYEYDYDINATTGAVVSYKKERNDDLTRQGNNNHTGVTGTVIGEAKAKEIALAHAGVSANNISGYEFELDYDNGQAVYEIKFKAGGYEYSYDINATTGAILKNKKKN